MITIHQNVYRAEEERQRELYEQFLADTDTRTKKITLLAKEVVAHIANDVGPPTSIGMKISDNQIKIYVKDLEIKTERYNPARLYYLGDIIMVEYWGSSPSSFERLKGHLDATYFKEEKIILRKQTC